MKNIILTSLLILALIPSLLYTSDQDSTKMRLGIGADVGYSQNNSLSGDIFGGAVIPINQFYAEANIGYLFFNNKTDYAGVDGILYDSRGIFIEGNAYFIKGFYAGFRYAFTFNWVDEESQEDFENESVLEAPEYFIGQTLNFQTGYLFELSNNVFFRFQGQVGIHNFEIAEGSFWQFGSSDSPPMRDMYNIESKIQLIYNLSLGLTFRIDS